MTQDGMTKLTLSLERKVWNAVIEEDGAALGKLLADSYIEITVDGKRIEKTEIVDLSPQPDEIEGYAIESEKVVSLGENILALSYHLTLDGKSRRTTISPRERWATSIWSRIDGRWLCYFFQQSPHLPKGANNPSMSIPGSENDEHSAHPSVRQLNQLLHARRGHFVLESGHHGDHWLDLELLCLHPNRIQPFASELAKRLTPYRIDAVCGPLVEGAFVGMMVANELDAEFVYTERGMQSQGCDLYPMAYRLPTGQRQRIKGKRVAIVNDVINAGSAVRGTYGDLKSCHANPVALASLLTLGDTPKALANEWSIDLITIGSQSNSIWTPDECPLCAKKMPLDNA